MAQAVWGELTHLTLRLPSHVAERLDAVVECLNARRRLSGEGETTRADVLRVLIEEALFGGSREAASVGGPRG